MGAVQKQDGIGALAQPFQAGFFLLAAIPQETEVTQDQENIVFAQPAQLLAFETVQLAVGVACNINHPCLPLVCESGAADSCHPPPNLLL